MKLFSTKVDFNNVEDVKKSLVKEGAIIYKIVDYKEIIPGLGLQPVQSQIFFYVMDETATIFKLKYPPGIFKEH